MTHQEPSPSDADRRSFSLASGAMTGGLLAGYGMLGYFAFRFLQPAREARRGWMFVRPLDEFGVGSTIRFRTPAGATVNITRRGRVGDASDFRALDSTCPHLGCQVHWEADKNRYFCPCHNGVFDPEGKGIGGPPGDAGQSLKQFDLRIDGGLLYIEVPLEGLASAGGEVLPADTEIPRGPGHDPCLGPRDSRGRPA